MAWNYPGALFLGAGGYHHHLGTNTWAGAGARPTHDDEAGLLEWTIELPDTASLDAAAASLAGAGYGVTRDQEDILTADPWRAAIRLRVATP
jgi:catechol 2,3-dioxygenase